MIETEKWHEIFMADCDEGLREKPSRISFPKYYRQQFRDLKAVWHMAKSCKRYWAFIATLFDLLNPFVIHTMWLYDTGIMVIDLRFYPNKKIEL